MTLLLLAPGCAPRDPEGTLEAVMAGQMRVGIATAPPWTTWNDGPGGFETQLVKRLAAELQTDITWRTGSESELLDALERFELDLVISGLTDDTPWATRIALTRPYLETEGESGKEKHVWALPPGENAWMLMVERFFHEHTTEISSQWKGIH